MGGARNCQTDTPADAGDNQLQPPGQADEGEHRPAEHGEGQDLFGDRGRAQEREVGEQGRAGALGVARPAQQFDEVAEVDDEEERWRNGADAAQEAQGEIASEGREQDHAGCVPDAGGGKGGGPNSGTWPKA